ncbi:MAG: methyltransferase domain-containing protein [Deltaproteobacteria bacterium]|nr:methyltransferase domain-containing protein [Deltaproteobacteria bacterium]
MSQAQNVLSAIEPWDLVAGGYAETTMQMLSHFAEEAVLALNVKPESTLLDVACGPGTLSLMVAGHAKAVHGIDFSEAMLHQFTQNIERSGHKNIFLRQGDAQELPYSNDTFDAAFSMFGLMFFPDRMKGFREIYRTLKPRGSIAVTSWAPVDQSPAMKIMFGAIRAMNPDMPAPQKAINSLENPDVFRKELLDAGFQNVQVQCVTKAAYPVPSVQEFWSDMVKGGAPIQMMKKNMSEQTWLEKESIAIRYLESNLPTIPTTLTSDAWLGLGTKPE